MRDTFAAFSIVLVVLLPTTSAPASPLDVVVTTAADLVNGDTSSVAALLARPGGDGISLREAIAAADHEAGKYTIRFANALRGTTIGLHSELPPLTGAGIAIDGDITGDGQPDVTITKASDFRRTGCPNDAGGCGLEIASSGNRVQGLTIVGFGTGIAIHDRQPSVKGPPVIRQSISNNVVSGLVLRGIGSKGIELGPAFNDQCGLFAGRPDPCWTYDTWANTTISGNTVEVANTGIQITVSDAGDRVDGVTITDNAIQVNGNDAGIGVVIGGNATDSVISGVLIARNSIVGRVDIGIEVVSGGQRAQANTIEDVQILDNQVSLVSRDSGFCCQGVVVQAGTDAAEAIYPNVLPLAYPDGNTTRNVLVRGNTLSGTLVWGMNVSAGLGAGGSSDLVTGVQLRSNTVTSTTRGDGVLIWTGGGSPIGGRAEVGDRISHVSVDANRIRVEDAPGIQPSPAHGILVVGAGQSGRNGSVDDLRITNNAIGPGAAQIAILGGDQGAIGSRVDGVTVINNTIVDRTGTALQVVSNANEGKGTSGNAVSGVSVTNTILQGRIIGEADLVTIRSSIVSDASLARIGGNILADPGFVDGPGGDFHLQPGSPAIDAGSADGAPGSDIDGVVRAAPHIDIGAYQFTGSRGTARASTAPPTRASATAAPATAAPTPALTTSAPIVAATSPTPSASGSVPAPAGPEASTPTQLAVTSPAVVAADGSRVDPTTVLVVALLAAGVGLLALARRGVLTR